jgi:hypothetical protein
VSPRCLSAEEIDTLTRCVSRVTSAKEKSPLCHEAAEIAHLGKREADLQQLHNPDGPY